MNSKTRMRVSAVIVAFSLLGSVAAWAATQPESVAEEQGHRRVATFAGKDHPTGPIEIPLPIEFKPVRELGGNLGGSTLFGFSAVPLGSVGASGSTTTDRIGASLKKAAEDLR